MLTFPQELENARISTDRPRRGCPQAKRLVDQLGSKPIRNGW